MGIQRGFLAAGEAICFGVDSIGIPYVVFASVIFGLYAIGIAGLSFLGFYYITETNYGREDDGVTWESETSNQAKEKTDTAM